MRLCVSSIRCVCLGVFGEGGGIGVGVGVTLTVEGPFSVLATSIFGSKYSF